MALVEGEYGLSSQVQSKNKTVIFVKLTDSAIRAIDDYLKIQQHKAGHRATLRFQGNEGNIRIPLSTNENGHSFDFSLSSNSDIEGPQGSFVCIQQCAARSLDIAGPLSYKMRIKANDDVFVQTQNRFAKLEEDRQQECAKEIKSNCPDIGRKVKKKMGLAPIPPQRREKSPSYISHAQPKLPHPSAPNFANSSNNSQKLPNGYNSNNNVANNLNIRKVINGNGGGGGVGGGSNTSVNGTASKNGIGPGSQGISRRPLKERLIHMLAVKPYKKLEINQRLYSDGLKEREKKEFMQILQQVANFKDNEYSLMRGVWNDVQEDWPFYSEQERQLMKRRKPQNLTPPGSDSSVGSGTSSLSPRSNCSIGSGNSPSYSHPSHYSKNSLSTNGSIGEGGKGSHDGGFEPAKAIKRPVSNGLLPDNTDYGDIPPKKTRVSHFKKPGSGGSGSMGNGANNHSLRPDLLAIKPELTNGSSPQFSSHNNRIAERLSPIGTNGSTNGFSVQNSSNGNGHISNRQSPRNINGNFEHMDVSPSHSYAASNGYHGSSQGDFIADEPVTVGSSWPSRNGNHDAHGFSDGEKPSRGDSDETDSIDSGNGSSTSGGSQHHNYNNYSNSNNNSHPVMNGSSNKPAVGSNQFKSENIHSSSDYLAANNNTSSLTNGCNRVSSTTSFHNTPQSSPDSQVDTLQLQQQKCQSVKNISAIHIKSNQRPNGKCNFDSITNNAEIVVSRDKGSDRDSHKDRDRNSRRSEKERLKEKERDSRNKDRDRSKRNSEKKHSRTAEKEEEDIDKNIPEHEFSAEYPSYLTYTAVSSLEQRSKYKDDFTSEYAMYRELHAVIDKVSKRFAHLEERLRQEERGTEGYEKVKELIVNEYYANKRDKKYQETRQKFQYLHEKLSHIKRLVADFDAKHQEQQDASNEYGNGGHHHRSP